MSGSSGVHRIVLRDLQSVLRKKLGDSISVTDYKVESFLQPGENYGSSMFGVHAIITRKENKKEELDLVAKMLPATDFQRTFFGSSTTFKKEIFFYDTLIPAYRNLEREFGVSDEELFDIGPEFFGSRLSMMTDHDMDEDAVILLQNLKVQGYYMADRKKALDLEHMKIALSSLARFHALGLAVKHHKPDFFDTVRLQAQGHGVGDDFDIEGSQKSFLRIFHDDPEMSMHYEKLQQAMEFNPDEDPTADPPELWATVIHADFWVNNIMFRKDPSTGKVSSVKFVDFQNYLYMSPLGELTFCLMANSSADVMENHFDEILDHYYDSFVQVLQRMKCDVEQFSRDKFDERLKIDASKTFPTIPLLVKIMTDDAKKTPEDPNVKKVFSEHQVNLIFVQKMRRCVKKFSEMGWFLDRKG